MRFGILCAVVWVAVVASLGFQEAMGALNAPPRAGGVAAMGSAAVAGRAGSCSGGGHTTQQACTGAGETWTPAVSASGATGLFEIRGVIETGIGLLIAIVVIWAAYRAVRMFILRGSRGG